MAAAVGVTVTPPGWWHRLRTVLTRRDPAARAEAERLLLEADFGPQATAEVLEQLARLPDTELAAGLEQVVTALVAGPDGADPGLLARAAAPPTVIVVFGVNGSGKTTTVAKLARRLQRDGRGVLLAAADTFRAGAVEQLRVWADRLEVPCVGAAGTATTAKVDPAAVAFDAVAAGAARGSDTVLVDTAGRLHTEARLMDELKRVVRAIAKRMPGAPHESLLVLDGTVGQNAVRQAVEFAAAVPLTGLIVTKLDGTAKGGSVVALRRAVPVPVRFLGTGETVDDLEVFDAARFARRLIGA